MKHNPQNLSLKNNMVTNKMNLITLALVCQQLICCFAYEITEDNVPRDEPFMSEKAELFRFSRDVKGGGWFSKIKESQQQQLVNHADQQQEQQVVEVKHEPQIPAQVPTFSESSSDEAEEQHSAVQQQESVVTETQQQQQLEQADQQQHEQEHQQTHEISLHELDAPAPETTAYLNLPSYSAASSAAVASAARYSFRPIKFKSPTAKTVTTTTTTRLYNEQPAPVHTVPVHYVAVPSHEATKVAHFEEEASSSSESSHRSSSSSTSSNSASAREEAESVAVSAPLQTALLQPVSSAPIIIKAPTEIQVSQSRVVGTIEPAAIAPEACCFVEKPTPVFASTLVVETAPVDDGQHQEEEQYQSDDRNLSEELHGLGGHLKSSLSSSSSSSSSASFSSSSSSRSSKTIKTSGHHQAATLLAPPVTVVHQPVSRVIAVKVKPVSASVSSSEHYGSVDVDYHYNGPNVRYGHLSKQQPRASGTKG